MAKYLGRTPPTEPGWYWFALMDERESVLVDWHPNNSSEMVVFRVGRSIPTPLSLMHGEWWEAVPPWDEPAN